MNGSNQAVTTLLNPLGLSDFFQTYWERTPLHLSRENDAHFASLLSIADVEELLSTQTLEFPSAQLTHSASPVEAADYIDGANRILAKQLVQRYHAGATLVLSQAHDRFADLAVFKREIQSALQLRCQTNVYLSPPGEQGFNPHYDSHDVFILQVAGSKTFNIYDGGVELPYSHESFQHGTHHCGALKQSIALEAGDTLYIPRGVMHDAVARDTTSLHITLGVYAITLQDVMVEMIHRSGERDIRFRRSIPASFLSDETQVRHAEAECLHACLHPDLDQASFRQAVATLLDDVAVDAAQNFTGCLSQPNSLITADTEVQLRRERIMGIERSDAVIRCRAQGHVLEFGSSLCQAMDQLLPGSWISVRQLLITTVTERESFCQELANAGLLNVR